jgi:hypothetical protein
VGLPVSDRRVGSARLTGHARRGYSRIPPRRSISSSEMPFSMEDYGDLNIEWVAAAHNVTATGPSEQVMSWISVRFTQIERQLTVRILFAFDRWRSSILLVAEDKAGQWNTWYRETIPSPSCATPADLPSSRSPSGWVSPRSRLPHRAGQDLRTGRPRPIRRCSRRTPAPDDLLRQRRHRHRGMTWLQTARSVNARSAAAAPLYPVGNPRPKGTFTAVVHQDRRVACDDIVRVDASRRTR